MTRPVEPLADALDGLVVFLTHWSACKVWADDGPCNCGMNDAKKAVIAAARVAAPSDGLREVQNDIEMLCYAILGGTSFLPHRDAAQRVLAALATTEQPEPCQPKSDDRWLCDVHGGYFGGRTSGGSRCSAAQPEDTRTAGSEPKHLAVTLTRSPEMVITKDGETWVCVRESEYLSDNTTGSALTPEATAPTIQQQAGREAEAKVWADALSDEAFVASMDEGLADVAAERTVPHRTDTGSEYGRLLAERDRLISEGVDPADLDSPLPPEEA